MKYVCNLCGWVYDEEEAVPKIDKYGFEKGHVFVVFGYEGLAEMVDLEVRTVRKYCEENHLDCFASK